jgi:hypothetical protein
MTAKPSWIPDATWLSDFRECPEKTRLRHVGGWVPYREDEAPASGSALHAGVKTWFDDEGVEAAVAALRAGWTKEAEEVEAPSFGDVPLVKRPLELFERVMRGYAARWPRALDDFRVVANEGYDEQFINLWGASFWWCGRKDRVIEWGDGRRSIMDLKSSAMRLDENYFRAYELSSQMRGYMAMELVAGKACDSVYIDAVHIDTYKRRKTKAGFTTYGGDVAPDDFVRHGPIIVPDWKLSEWARSVEHALRQREWFMENVGPDARWEQRDGACFKWGKPCAFWGVCNIHRDAIAGTLQREYTVRRWFPNPADERVATING